MKSLSIRSSLMATLGLFTLMLIVGAALGMAMLTRANERFIMAQNVAGEARDINDIYMDTSRTRLALMRVYADVRDEGTKPSASANLATAQRYLQRGQDALQAFIKEQKSTGTDTQMRSELVAATRTLYGSLGQAVTVLQADDVEAYQRINLEKLTAEGAAVSKLLDRFQQHSTELAKQLMADRDAEFRMVKLLVGLGILLALALVGAAHYFLKRAVLAPLDNAIGVLDQVARGDLTGSVPVAGNTEIGCLMGCIAHMQSSFVKTVARVRHGAQSIERVAHEVASGNADLSARTETQASSLQETAASMEELTSTVQQTTENTQKARELVSAASSSVTVSTDVMGRMVETMTQIDDASHQVADIVAVIDGIAFQTNILALNAAVEAARAGDQGRGFAVVANEVRALAQRSAVAAKEIKGLIEHSVGKVRSGSELADQARLAMGDMADSVRKVADIVIDIAEASKEQSQGISQVNEAIAQMDDVTQRNAALVEQAAAATQVMSQETEHLIDAVSVFKVPSDESSNSHRKAVLEGSRRRDRLRQDPMLA
jgi:methyl-accepting chemotaxis protein